jgi:hypothetical protein
MIGWISGSSIAGAYADGGRAGVDASTRRPQLSSSLTVRPLIAPVRRSSPNRCPSCREHVSPYAAGCALCGADLVPDRGRHVPLSRRIGSAWDAFSVRADLIVLALVALVVLAYLTGGGL